MIAFRPYRRFAFLFITGCLMIFEESEAQCVLKGRCHFVCSGQSGDVTVDLSAIDGSPKPMFPGIKDSGRAQYTYDFNPCSSFTEASRTGLCTNVNVCQKNSKGVGQDVGDSVKMVYSENLETYSLTYTGFGGRVTKVTLVYKSGEEGYIPEVVENPVKYYTMTLYTKYAPGDGSGGGGGGGGGISMGTVLVIIFFVVLVLYLGIGIGFLRYRTGAQGKDMIPHYEFWSKIPGLAKDGCVFSAKKSKECCETAREKTSKGGGEQGEYEKI